MKKNHLLSLFSCLILCNAHFAGTSNTNGSSTNYSSAGAWNGGVPNLQFWQQGTVIGNVKHDLNYTGNLKSINRQELIIHSGATLTITGNLELGNLGRVTVLTGGNLIVSGNLTLGNNSIFSNSGTTSITGNISKSSSAKPVLGGTTNVGGNFIGVGGGTSTTVTGVLNIDGQLNLQQNSTMRGTGIVQWNTAYIYWSGFSYIYCNNGSKYGTDGWGHVDPPANPLDLSTCGSAVLAVDLLSFSIIKNHDAVIFNWRTGSETNAGYYELLFSVDGENWTSMATTSAAGTTNLKSDYSIELSKNDISNYNFYQLTEIDHNGTVNYFPIKHLEVEKQKSKITTTQNENEVIMTHELKAEKIETKIVDLQGKTHSQNTSSNESGQPTQIVFETTTLRQGIYMMIIKTSSSQYIKKIFIDN